VRVTTTINAQTPRPRIADLMITELNAELGRQRVSRRALSRLMEVDSVWLDRRIGRSANVEIEVSTLELACKVLGMTYFDLLDRVRVSPATTPTTTPTVAYVGSTLTAAAPVRSRRERAGGRPSGSAGSAPRSYATGRTHPKR
jgi:hypothetical protein